MKRSRQPRAVVRRVPRRHRPATLARPRRVPPARPAQPLEPGDWAWACREGYEAELARELELLYPATEATPVATGLARSRVHPRAQPVFARQALPVQRSWPRLDEAALGQAAAWARTVAQAAPRAWALDVWSLPHNRAAREVARVRAQLLERLEGLRPPVDVPRSGARAADTTVVQVALLPDGTTCAGTCLQRDLPASVPGGITRLRMPRGAPSRAVLKFDEALAWSGFEPQAGETAVDLGAAPGGWTWRMAQRGVRVLAVDGARLRPQVVALTGVEAVRANAFRYEPPRPVDWLLCDMAFRPLDVARLLGRWAREHRARFLLANFKLPMRAKVEITYRVLDTLREAGWRDVRGRQLFHDRDEFTVCAWR